MDVISPDPIFLNLFKNCNKQKKWKLQSRAFKTKDVGKQAFHSGSFRARKLSRFALIVQVFSTSYDIFFSISHTQSTSPSTFDQQTTVTMFDFETFVYYWAKIMKSSSNVTVDVSRTGIMTNTM